MRKGKMRAWRLDEYNDCSDDDERDDRAWAVPDVRGILNPDAVSPVEDIDEAAEKFADYCHARRDGWEWSWPQEFVIDDGEKLWLVEVDREVVPEFNAGRAKEMPRPTRTDAARQGDDGGHDDPH